MAQRSRVAETALKVLSAISACTAIFDVWRAFNPPGHGGSPWLGMMFVLAAFIVGHLAVSAAAFGAAAYARTAELGTRRTIILVIAGVVCGAFQLLGMIIAWLASL